MSDSGSTCLAGGESVAARDSLLEGMLSWRGRELFLISFLVLFLELACIRWFAAHVVFLQFFTNIVLIACFLGMSIGCMCAKSADWLRRFPGLAGVSIAVAVLTSALYSQSSGLAIDVGHQESPQMVFFGTEFRSVDLAKLVIPMEAVAAIFFVLITLTFVGPGQVLGRVLDNFSNRVVGYTINIAGSLTGVVVFSAISCAGVPPVIWFFVAFAGAAFLLKQTGRLYRVQLVTLAAGVLLVGLGGSSAELGTQARWSPYYMVRFTPANRHIIVNTISHQQMVGVDEGGPVYSLVHLLNRDSGGGPFEDTLIIGAGSGNDVAHALKNGVRHVDAVEIDPVIYELGREHHPDRPYHDPRVSVHLDDGRNFLHRTDRKYDLVTYALVDSLILQSSYSNIRLESFLFTQEAFQGVRNVLKPGGVFVMYNYFRQGWIVERMARMAEEVFGKEPVILSLPYVGEIRAEDNQQNRLTVLIVGDTDRIAAAFREHGTFWLSRTAAPSQATNGFESRRDAGADAASSAWLQIAPARLVRSDRPIELATDDWPFLYLRSRLIPWLSVRGMAVIGVLGLVLLFALSPGHRVRFNGRMFFLGAAFLLLETRAVVHLALLFGSTWLVNSLVFSAILVMILASNLYVLKVPIVRLGLHYAGLFTLLAINCLVPLDVFLAASPVLKYIASCLLVFMPVFFAGVIFARSFRDSRSPDQDFGSNIAGAVVGGLAECSSMLLGFRYVLLVALAFYALSAAFRRGRSLPTV